MSPFDELTSEKWTLSDLPGNSSWQEKFPDSLPFLEFDDGGRLNGSTGCNNFHGNFSLTGNGIEIDPGAMTRKMCSGNGEKLFLEALATVEGYVIENNTLILKSNSGPVLQFSR